MQSKHIKNQTCQYIKEIMRSKGSEYLLKPVKGKPGSGMCITNEMKNILKLLEEETD